MADFVSFEEFRDNLDTSNVTFVGDLARVRPETVHDLESGVTLSTPLLRLQANAFWMDFRNEIEPIGALSYQGLPLRKNVSRSYRRGVEVDGSVRLTAGLTLSGNATLMMNPGIYVIAGGGFTVTGSANVTGSCLILYNGGSSYPANGGNFGGITLSGNEFPRSGGASFPDITFAPTFKPSGARM